MESVCVYCGSSMGKKGVFRRAAAELGGELARRGLTLVYGGSRIGLMGAVADAALGEGGKVIGVLPEGLDRKEVAHAGLTELHRVKDMHERKAKMASLSDAFIALPGGFGTMDEIMEMITWNQLGFQAKPIGFLNVEGYYDDLFRFLGVAARQDFIKPDLLGAVVVLQEPAKLLDRMTAAPWPDLGAWPKTK